MRFAKQTGVHAIHAFGDSDWAGDRCTCKSTPSGVLQVGDHPVKSWASTQPIIALSVGEAELYATNKAAAQALGLQSLLEDLGVRLDVRLFTDSSTTKAIITRTGLGKLRHIDTNELWLQERIKNTEITQIKINNIYNVADLMTKAKDAGTIRSLMELLEHHHEEGRNVVAPELNRVDDDDGLIFYLRNKIGLPCYHP